MAGHLPSLRVTLGRRLLSASCEQVESSALKSRTYDPPVIDWDTAIAPCVDIEWCEFRCELVPAIPVMAP